MNKRKNIILAIVVCLIVAAIFYLQSQKPVAVTPTDIVVGDDSASTTPETVSATTTLAATTTVKKPQAPIANRSSIRAEKAAQYSRAKEFVDPQGFVNTQPFKLSDIVGKKVVLIDFWTYSCINCQRTIPYLNAWYQKYKDVGLEIVGVHTPEFDFEKEYGNVSKAVAQFGIKYPVVLDSTMGTWNAYQNLYWPREYLIDIDGFIVHDHIGEGSYAETEQAIQHALIERNTALGISTPIPTTITTPADVIAMDPSKVGSLETYFGSNRNQYLANGMKSGAGVQTLSIPSTTEQNALYLDGTWNFKNEYAETVSTSAKILYKYSAKNVYFVGSSKSGVPIKVFVDGKLVNTITVKDNKLYNLVQGSDYGEHTLEIEVDGAGLDAFTFTFG